MALLHRSPPPPRTPEAVDGQKRFARIRLLAKKAKAAPVADIPDILEQILAAAHN